MTEKEITERLCDCIEKAYGGRFDEVGVKKDEDGEMFFEEGYFCILLDDGRLCKTTYKAEDFLSIRYRDDGGDLYTPYVVIYLKNGDRLEYYNFEWAEEQGTNWTLKRVGKELISRGAEIFDFFGQEWNAHKEE